MPVSDFVKGVYDRIGKISEQYPAANTEAILKALSEGGSLRNSLGFNSPTELMGLTPQAFQQSMDSRIKLQDSMFNAIKDVTSLSDTLSGNKETRQALFNMAPHELSALSQESINKDTQAAADARNAANNIAAMERAKLQESGATSRTRMQIGSAQALQNARFKFEERMKKAELAALTAASGGDTPADHYPGDTGMFNALEKRINGYFVDGELQDENRVSYGLDRLRQEALGNRYGTIYNTSESLKEKYGWPNVILTPHGWYGVKLNEQGKVMVDPRTGAPHISKNPIVPLSVPTPKSSNRSSSMVHKYDFEE